MSRKAKSYFGLISKTQTGASRNYVKDLHRRNLSLILIGVSVNIAYIPYRFSKRRPSFVDRTACGLSR